ncbi:MAG: hypothetical protein HY240_09690 [Actinobacteria bacterium]|nr:hypothetical protein [Actinomycetota bacterium]
MRKIGLGAAAALAASLVMILGAGSALADPAGNNGTVKIEGTTIDSIPDNAPHQGCIFTIEFRGYDEGDLYATYSLDAQPPSGSGVNVTSGSTFIGEDPAGGANDLDSTVTIDLSNYDLSGLIAHPQQGFHLKLTVHARGSIGADVKHKVFWVTGCPAYPPVPTEQVTGLPASFHAAEPKPSGIRWTIVGLALFASVGIATFTRRRLARR